MIEIQTERGTERCKDDDTIELAGYVCIPARLAADVAHSAAPILAQNTQGSWWVVYNDHGIVATMPEHEWTGPMLRLWDGVHVEYATAE